MREFVLISLILVLFSLGCSSSGGNVLAPDVDSNPKGQSAKSHYLWGYWQGVIDPDAKAIEFIQLRSCEFHLNALPFLEPPPFVNLTLATFLNADFGFLGV